MSHCTGSLRLLLHGLFVLMVCCSGLVTARADTYPPLTFFAGDFFDGSGGGNPYWAGGGGDFAALSEDGNYWFLGSVSFGGPVFDYSNICVDPDPGPVCLNYNEYGSFSGPVTISGFTQRSGGIGQQTYYQFDGTIIQGVFWQQTRGEWSAGEADAYFTGTWNNGFQAEGLVRGFNGSGFGGQIAVTTFTPEPSTLIMFGSGIIGLAARRRRR